MNDVQLYKSTSTKPFERVLKDLEAAVEEFGFRIYHHSREDLVDFYRSEGVSLPADYQHVMLQVCKPENSGKVVPFNPDRAIFVQKLIFVYSRGGTTELRTLGYSARLMADLLGHHDYPGGPTDDQFAAKMAENFTVMDQIIQKAVA
jgi:hypothetical protein